MNVAGPMRGRLSNPKEKIDAAKSTLDVAELKELAQDTFACVREAVAVNPATPEDVLLGLLPDKIASDHDFEVIAALLTRASMPNSVARRICTTVAPALGVIEPRDYHGRTCWDRLVAHPVICISDLAPLLQPKICPRHLRGGATSSSRKDVLELLTHDDSSTVARRATQRLQQLGQPSSG